MHTKAYELVTAGCIRQHGRNWLTEPLVKAFCQMFRTQARDADVKRDADGTAHNGNGHRVRLHSIELWLNGALVAGELGYSVGTIYTSQTGFFDKAKADGAGAVQLAALGRFLQARGCTLWDFGMEMEYKRKLGAETIARADWQTRARAAAGATDQLLLLDQLERIPAREVIERKPLEL